MWQAGRPPAAQCDDLAIDWMRVTYELVMRQAVLPPVAARAYAYTSIALYEATTDHDRECRSFGGQHNAMAAMPSLQAGVLYDRSLAAMSLVHPQACLTPAEWELAAVISRTRQPAPGIGMEDDDPASAAGAAKQT
jgi:hypothetical protein